MKEVCLKKLQEKDIPILTTWLSMPHVKEWFHDESSWLDEINQRHTTYSFVHHFIVYVADKPIGFCQYYDYQKGQEDWHGTRNIENTYSIDYMIGEPAYLHQGYGVKMVKALLKITFQEPDCQEIIVQPEPGNATSRATCQKAGLIYDALNDVFYQSKKVL